MTEEELKELVKDRKIITIKLAPILIIVIVVVILALLIWLYGFKMGYSRAVNDLDNRLQNIDVEFKESIDSSIDSVRRLAAEIQLMENLLLHKNSTINPITIRVREELNYDSCSLNYRE
jgi:sensor domain CHASE-containing protein